MANVNLFIHQLVLIWIILDGLNLIKSSDTWYDLDQHKCIYPSNHSLQLLLLFYAFSSMTMPQVHTIPISGALKIAWKAFGQLILYDPE